MIARASDKLLACLIHGFDIFRHDDAIANSVRQNRLFRHLILVCQFQLFGPLLVFGFSSGWSRFWIGLCQA
jgi:hypothetical protein